MDWNPRRGNPRASYGGLYDFRQKVPYPNAVFAGVPSEVRDATGYERALAAGLGYNSRAAILRVPPDPTFGWTGAIPSVQVAALRPPAAPVDLTRRAKL